jgi:NDP-sugar pyrophosphorylase family protein
VGSNWIGSEMSLNVIITAAGLGTRLEGEYTIKPLAQLLGRSILWWSMTSLIGQTLESLSIIIPDREDDRSTTKSAITRIVSDAIEKFRIDVRRHFIIPESTPPQGQMMSALLAEPYIDIDNPIVIMPCDSLIDNSFFGEVLRLGSDVFGCISVHDSPGTNWSFVKLGAEGLAVAVQEKNRISDLCSTGYYYFRSMRDYGLIANKCIDHRILVKNEFYISSVYQSAIEIGYKITAHRANLFLEYGSVDSMKSVDKKSLILSCG